MAPGTPRDRMVEATSRLFSRRGYAATTMRAIVEAARAPWGSSHHYFPGGKPQIGVEAIELGDARVRAGIAHCLAVTATPGDAVRAYFGLAADVLESSGWEEGCPVAGVALETAGRPGPVGVACVASFAAWQAAWAEAFASAGLAPEQAAELATIVVTNVEGGLVLARVARSREPMELAARTAGALVDAGLAPGR